MIIDISTDGHGSRAQAGCPPEPVAEEPDDLVTIAIPTYNRADGFLAASIESALAQTHPNIEVLVADNCSSDHTGDVVRSFKDPRISYFRHPTNIGPFRNYNFCVGQARGRYFCLLCDDDLMDPDFVATCLARVREAGEFGLIQTGTRLIDNDGRVIREIPNRGASGDGRNFVTAWFRYLTSPYPCSTMFVTAGLREVGGFEDNNLLGDVLTEFQLAQRFGSLVVEDVKASFRLHDGKLTHACKVKDWCSDSIKLLGEMQQCVPPRERDALLKEGRKRLALMNYYHAAKVIDPWQRMLANIAVMRSFGYSCPPPAIQKLWRRVRHSPWRFSTRVGRWLRPRFQRSTSASKQ